MVAFSKLTYIGALLAGNAVAAPAVLEARVGPQLASLSFYTSCKNFNQNGMPPQEQNFQVFNNTYTVCHTSPFNGVVVHNIDSTNRGALNKCKVNVWKAAQCLDGGNPANFLGGFSYTPVKPGPCVDAIGGLSWRLSCPFVVNP